MERLKKLLNDSNKYDAYLILKDLFIKKMLNKSLPENWREIISILDEVYDFDNINDIKIKKDGSIYVGLDTGCETVQQCKIKESSITFKQELTSLINKYNLENTSNTPDFILADYLINCLDSYNKIKVWNDKLHSIDGVPENERENGPILDRANGTIYQ